MFRFKSYRAAAVALLLVAASAVPGRAAQTNASKPWPPDQFAPLTLERIESLPRSEQSAWKNYFKTSRNTATLRATRAQPDNSPTNILPLGSRAALHSKGLVLQEPDIWLTQPAPAVIADRIVANQSAAGGWTKGIDYTKPFEAPPKADAWSNGTFDNNATTTELRYLARVITKFKGTTNVTAWQKSFDRGLQYIFKSQYPNGGFPQIYPLAGGYHDNVTYNDGVMERVLEFLRDVAHGGKEFSFVSNRMKQEAARRFELGVRCILASQIRNADGRRTVWCQQHDALTLKPAAARNFEPVAACAAESAGITGLLMSLTNPPPEVVQAVESAIEWFRKTQIPGITWDRFTNNVSATVAPSAPPMWARLYELETDKPIFGDRDRTIHYEVITVSEERRRGYAWYGYWPAEVLAHFESWREFR
ncbi:MAG TPA: pectate lyase [Verrucomicrobiota bacterium]|nr:pectate lyase [Verrucomicrobiota bacterium]